MSPVDHGPAVNRSFKPKLTPAYIDGLEAQKNFLRDFNFLAGDFDARAWVVPAPLADAERVVREQSPLQARTPVCCWTNSPDADCFRRSRGCSWDRDIGRRRARKRDGMKNALRRVSSERNNHTNATTPSAERRRPPPMLARASSTSRSNAMPNSESPAIDLVSYVDEAKRDAIHAYNFLRESGTLSASLTFNLTARKRRARRSAGAEGDEAGHFSLRAHRIPCDRGAAARQPSVCSASAQRRRNSSAAMFLPCRPAGRAMVSDPWAAHFWLSPGSGSSP